MCFTKFKKLLMCNYFTLIISFILIYVRCSFEVTLTAEKNFICKFAGLVLKYYFNQANRGSIQYFIKLLQCECAK